MRKHEWSKCRNLLNKNLASWDFTLSLIGKNSVRKLWTENPELFAKNFSVFQHNLFTFYNSSSFKNFKQKVWEKNCLSFSSFIVWIFFFYMEFLRFWCFGNFQISLGKISQSWWANLNQKKFLNFHLKSSLNGLDFFFWVENFSGSFLSELTNYLNHFFHIGWTYQHHLKQFSPLSCSKQNDIISENKKMRQWKYKFFGWCPVF